MPGSSDDESVDSLDEWLKGGPSSKKAVAVGAHVVGASTGDDDDSDLDSVDREIERVLREGREGSRNKEDSAKKPADEKSNVAPNAARASARASTTPAKRSRRGVAWHHEEGAGGAGEVDSEEMTRRAPRR